MFPVLFSIGPLDIRTYSLMYIIAVMVAIFILPRRLARMGYSRGTIENGVMITFFSAIVGARFYYVVFSWGSYAANPLSAFAIWQGGLAIHGGILGGAIGLYLFARKNGFSPIALIDAAVPVLLFGQIIGRIGNVANGEAGGVPIYTPFSIIFRWTNHFPEFWAATLSTYAGVARQAGVPVEQVIADGVTRAGELSVMFQGQLYTLQEYVPWGVSFPLGTAIYNEFNALPVHPTFYYEMFFSSVALLIVLYFWRKNMHIGSGLITAIYGISYGLNRGFITFFRSDDLMLGFIRAPHLASLALICIAIAILVYHTRGYYKRSKT